MMKNRHALYISFAVVLLGITLFTLLRSMRSDEGKIVPVQKSSENSNQTDAIKNIAYIFDGRPVKLENGQAAEQAAPGSASLITTKFFGNEVFADLNKDGKQDVVLYLTQEQGGSGTFFYVAVALASGDGFKGSEAYYVGDRIAPQPITVNEHGVILVNYVDRSAGQSFTDVPSLGKTIRLKLDADSLRFGIVADIPGEADPARMTLSMKTWQWQTTQLADKSTITPKQLGKFSLTFTPLGRVSIGTDCNAASGVYEVDNMKILFSRFASTEMFCENSQESLFLQELSGVTDYVFTDRGELRLTLGDGVGMMIFK